MTIPRHSISKDQLRIAQGLLSLAAGLLFLAVTPSTSINLSPDSVDYLSVARSLADGQGFTLGSGEPLVLQPPGLPLVLAAIDVVFGMDPLDSILYFHALLLVLITYMSARMFTRQLPSWPGMALVGTMAVPSSLALWSALGSLWTEPLFIALVLAHLTLCEAYLARPSLRGWVLLAITIALACLVRYIGIVLFVTAGLTLIAAHWGSPRTWLTRGMVLVFIAAPPLALWLAHNLVVSDAMFGPRAAPMVGFSDIFSKAMETLVRWYLPRGFFAVMEWLALAAILIGAIAYRIVHTHHTPSWREWRRRLPLGVFVVVYTLFLLHSASTTAFDALNDRLMLPIFLPLTILLFVYVAFVTRGLFGRFLSRQHLGIALSLSAALWVIYRATLVMDALDKRAVNGTGYGSTQWHESETAAYLRNNPNINNRCHIYSNGKDIVYLLGGRTAKATPAWTLYNSDQVLWTAESYKGVWPKEDNACVVWFDAIDRPYLFTLEHLRGIADFRLIERLEDGAVYAVQRR